MKMFFRVAVLAIVAMTACQAAFAGCGGCGSGALAEASASSAVCNSTCPVSGEAISGDRPYTAEVGGKNMGFCSAACAEAYKADPAAYAANVETKTE